MAKIYLSVVSHDNDELIRANFVGLPTEIGKYSLSVLVVDNTSSSELKRLCAEHNLSYFSDGVRRGYGGNNNLNYRRAQISAGDIFIVCNPDITITIEQLEELISTFTKSTAHIYGVKVYECSDLSRSSSHNRMFPCLFDPLVSLVFKRKLFARDIDQYSEPDWIGGAFMVFRAEVFGELNGFDERYFMYYEDVDLCHRAQKMGLKIIYDPSFYVIHEAKRQGRKIFSQHFLWNLVSMIKYFSRFPPRCLVSSTAKEKHNNK